MWIHAKELGMGIEPIPKGDFTPHPPFLIQIK